MSQKGCAQIGDAAGVVDRLDRLGDGRRLAQAEGRPALDQVPADQRADVVDAPRCCRRSALAGAREHGAGQVRAADRFAGGDARCRSRASSSSKPTSRRASRHAQRALLAVGEEVGQRARSAAGRCGRCRSRGCAVRAAPATPVVDGGDLDRRDDAHADALAGGDRLGDAADGVVVGQREQLHAGLGGALRRPRAAGRAPSEWVECDCRSKRGATARQRMRSPQESGVLVRRSCRGRRRGG